MTGLPPELPPWWTWEMLDRLPPSVHRRLLRAAAESRQDQRIPADVLPAAPTGPDRPQFTDLPPTLEARPQVESIQERTANRRTSILEALQREREKRAQAFGPRAAGFVEGVQRTAEPIAAAFGNREAIESARARRALQEEGYALPSENTVVARGGEAGPIGKALGARTAAEAGETAGVLAASAPAFMAGGEFTQPLSRLATRGAVELGLPGPARAAVSAAARGVGEFGAGAALQTGAEEATAGASPKEIIQAATRAGLAGATSPLALLHVPGETARRVGVSRRVKELRTARGARMTGDLVPGAVRVPPEPRVPGRVEQALTTIGEEPVAALTGAAVGGAVGAQGPDEGRTTRAIAGAVAGAVVGPHLRRAGERLAPGEAGGTEIGPLAPTPTPAPLAPDVSRFRSRMTDAITNARFAKGTAEQWRALVRTDVNQAEVRDTGLDAFLEANKGKVLTREQVLAASQPLQVHEVQFGATATPEQRALQEVANRYTTERATARARLIGVLDQWEGQGGQGRNLRFDIADRIAAAAYNDNPLDTAFPDLPQTFADPAIRQAATEFYDAVRRHSAAEAVVDANPVRAPQYDNPKYSLPGGDHYREIVLTAPPVGGGEPFQGGHFEGVENNVGWMRVDEREIGGHKTLFSQEYQSDPHQKARERGYRAPGKAPALQVVEDQARQAYETTQQFYKDAVTRELRLGEETHVTTPIATEHDAPVFLGPVKVGSLHRAGAPGWYFYGPQTQFGTGSANLAEAFDHVRDILTREPHRVEALLQAMHDRAELNVPVPETMRHPQGPVGRPETAAEWAYRGLHALRDREQTLGDAMRARGEASHGIPPLPFAKTEDWLGLLLRRQIAEAVQSGATKIGWTKASQQAARWDTLLQEHVDHVTWDRETGQLGFFKNGVRVSTEVPATQTLEEIANVVGQDIAKRLVASAEETGGHGNVRGTDITVGADFYRLIYDKLMPRVARDYMKKLGLKVEPKLETMEGAGSTGQITRESIRLEARDARGETRDFLDEVANELDEGELDERDIENAIDTVRNNWTDQEAEHRIDQWEPDIPDLDYFEEGARDYIEEEYGTPLRDAIKELYSTTNPDLFHMGPTREMAKAKLSHAQLTEALAEGSFDRETEHSLTEILSAMDEGEPITYKEMQDAADQVIDEKVTSQAEMEQRNYEPEPMTQGDRERLYDEAVEDVNDRIGTAVDIIYDHTPGQGEPAEVWTLEIPAELKAQVQSGRATYLYSGLDPGRLRDLPPEAIGAAVGGAVGAATGDDTKDRLGRAAIGATLGAVGTRRFSEAFRERRARTSAEAFRETPPLEASAAAPPAPAPELPEPRVPAVRAEPHVLAGRAKPVNVDDYVNLAKFDTDPAGTERLKAEVTRVVQNTGMVPKQVVPWAETRRLAAQMGLDLNDKSIGTVNRRLDGPTMLAIRGTVNRRLDGPTMLAIRNILSANVEALERLSQRRAPLPEGSEPAVALDRQIHQIENQNARLLERFIQSRSQTGRDLNNMKIVANRTLEPTLWLSKATQLAGRDLTADEITTISRLAEQRDRAGLVRYVANLRRSTPFEKLVTFWKAGLLTNPKTHVVNIVSNTTMQALEVAKDPVAALADRLLSLASGTRTKGGWNGQTIPAGLRGAAEGLREARATLRGEPTGDALAKYDLPRDTNYDNAFLDVYTKTVFRLLGAEDRVFWWAAFRRSVAEQATVAGRQMGLRGVKLRDYIADAQKGRGQMADELTTQGMADADLTTFRDRTALGDVAAYAARRFQPFEFIIPFRRTPAAVATSVLRYSPAGLGKAAVWDLPRFLTAVAQGKDKIGGVPLTVVQRQLAEAVGRGTVGSAAIWLGWLLAKDGNATGAAPTTGSKERQQWLQENRQANSVKVDDTWYQVGRISPVGNLIALGANLRAIWGPEGGDRSPTERYAEVVASGLRTVADQPFVTGVSSALNALQQPEREAARFAQGLEASVVPAIVGAAARGLDPTARMRSGPAGPVLERIPGVRQSLPEQVTPLGEPVQRGPTSQPAALLNAMFNPFTAAPDLRASDPLIRELAAAGYAVPRLPQEKGEGSITYTRRQQLYGRTVRAALEATVQSPAYQALQAQEQQLQQEATRLATTPGWNAHPVEQIQRALEDAMKASTSQPVTRAEALQRVVTQVRAQITRALVPR